MTRLVRGRILDRMAACAVLASSAGSRVVADGPLGEPVLWTLLHHQIQEHEGARDLGAKTEQSVGNFSTLRRRAPPSEDLLTVT